MMEDVQTKINILSGVLKDKLTLKKILLMAMIILSVIIAIILVSLIIKYSFSANSNDYSKQDIVIRECDDEKVSTCINDYFNAKTNLNLQRIFEAYGRDYYKEEREDRDGNIKKLVDNLRYEKIFIESYDDIKIYICNSYRDGDIVAIVTYDLKLGFTDVKAPMIVLFYLVKKDNTYIINDDIDVGISKFLVDVSNDEYVKSLYKDVETRLERAASGSESLRLAYNSLRQMEVNQHIDMGIIDRKALVDRFYCDKIDLVGDAKKIYEDIVAESEEKAAKERYDNFISNLRLSSQSVTDINYGTN